MKVLNLKQGFLSQNKTRSAASLPLLFTLSFTLSLGLPLLAHAGTGNPEQATTTQTEGSEVSLLDLIRQREEASEKLRFLTSDYFKTKDETFNQEEFFTYYNQFKSAQEAIKNQKDLTYKKSNDLLREMDQKTEELKSTDDPVKIKSILAHFNSNKGKLNAEFQKNYKEDYKKYRQTVKDEAANKQKMEKEKNIKERKIEKNKKRAERLDQKIERIENKIEKDKEKLRGLETQSDGKGNRAAPPATNQNPVSVAQNEYDISPIPVDPEDAKNPACWVTRPNPIAEIVPNVIFATNKSNITQAQADAFMSQLKSLKTKLKEANYITEPDHGNFKISAVQAVSSASFIPRRSQGGNEALAKDRGNAINAQFQAGLKIEEDLSSLLAPEFGSSIDESSPYEQGPAWNSADLTQLKGKKPTEEQIRAKAQEIIDEKGNAPFSSKIEDVILELKECCSNDQFDLKYKPHQYAKIKIYGADFNPNAPGCIQHKDRNPKMSDNKGGKGISPPPVNMPENPAPTQNPDLFDGGGAGSSGSVTGNE